ncbi:MAG: methionine--tRNA ligase [Planctomycetota bacterium]|nr:MAG: methionine--tRNA ligase [Planctomycetota bacterium]
MTSQRRRILVTSALPYANGHIHIGHLVEYLQTDIWVRFQKMRGHDCRYFCADDTHGTAITIRARQEGRSEEDVIAEMSDAHQQDFADFDIVFDHYASTNNPSNRALCEDIWQHLREQDMVVERTVSRLFDAEAGSFLADRFVKGTCPKCGAENQYGDSCDHCGATYAATDLLNPVSVLSGSTPQAKDSNQLFVRIEKLHPFLEEWTQSGDHLQPEVANYLKGHFLNEPLRDWDVSRPAPYFGFEIPDSPGNYWYVWFDAPIGYIASCKEWCDAHGEDFGQWWGTHTDANDATEIHHFIGKDIQYFHTLFWPAMLKVAGYKLPTSVRIHGFLTVDGEKMSKSKGTFVAARTYLKHLDPAYLRYYYASKLNHRVDDIDLNLEEFVHKINADLVGKVVNLASRCARFVEGERLAQPQQPCSALTVLGECKQRVAQHYEQGNFAAAMREIMAVADQANEFIEAEKPWVLAKDPEQRAALVATCTQGLLIFWQLVIMLGPVLPRLLEKACNLFGVDKATWDSAILGHTVGTFKHLMQRVDGKAVAAMINETASNEPNTADPAAAANNAAADSSLPALGGEPLAPTIAFPAFQDVDLRVARITHAETVPKSNKLLKITVHLGGDETRCIFAGIAKAYKTEDLLGRLVMVVANLAPRTMRFGVSEGMICAAGPGGKDIFLLSPDSGAQPGMRIS